jgi:phosphoribosyl 1,2-cyclic phosphodiesterase
LVNILIDCGKTFRSSILRCFPLLGIGHIDAVILTHAHADAFLGLDDLRDVAFGRSIPVYTSAPCFEIVSRAFPYLIKKPSTPGLHIASLDWRIIEPFTPFEFEGIIIVPLPLVHGPPEPMLGFEFSNVAIGGDSGRDLAGSDRETEAEAVVVSSAAYVSAPTLATTTLELAAVDCKPSGDRIVYLSDLAALPADTRAFLIARPISVLVLDALSYNAYPTHFRFRQSVACALDLRAETTVFTGLNHNVDYRRENKKLHEFGLERGVKIECGYDGWCVPISLTRERSLGTVQSEVDCARLGWLDVPVPVGEEEVGITTGSPPGFRYLGMELPTWEQGQGPASSTRN